MERNGQYVCEFCTQNMATNIPPALHIWTPVFLSLSHTCPSSCRFPGLTFLSFLAVWARAGPGVWFSFWEGKYLQWRGLRGAGPGFNYGVCHPLCNAARLENTHCPTSAGVRSCRWMRCRGVMVCVCLCVCVRAAVVRLIPLDAEEGNLRVCMFIPPGSRVKRSDSPCWL